MPKMKKQNLQTLNFKFIILEDLVGFEKASLSICYMYNTNFPHI